MATSLHTNFISDTAWSAIVTSLGLSARESEIARMILSDSSEAAIASALAISPHTVHTHLERLYRKLSVTSRCQVTVRIFQQYVLLADAASTRCTDTGSSDATLVRVATTAAAARHGREPCRLADAGGGATSTSVCDQLHPNVLGGDDMK